MASETTNQSPKSSQEKSTALEKIKSGKVKMHSKLYFVLKTLLWAIGAVLIFIASVYLVNLLFLVLHKSGLWLLPTFGPKGMKVFLSNFPWILLLIVLIFVALLEILIRRFSVAYKRPMIYSILAILVLISLIGFLIQKSSFNEHILKQVEKGHLPITNRFYNRYGMQRPENVYFGVVIKINNDKSFFIKEDNGTLRKVEILSSTYFPQKINIKEGDYIMVMGRMINGIIRAEGIRKIDDLEKKFNPPPFSPSFLPPD
ncbi:MAG TPA: hypothetical protein PL164_02610 [Candidatus Paceibacterota bacterium]|nr:hypothetical protein [Candidatus Paceibacterota bacterium]HOK94448.1 hypothetical protein [Candidatus Pacearchaeota archaeon]HPQ23094.1 hypothetical protein [Candidatus Paceibacterota bacterium]